MTYLDCFRAALQSLRVNVLRSVLTALGIIIGVAAVVQMVAIGAGAQARVETVMRNLGSNLLLVLPGTTTSGGVRMGAGSLPTLSAEDAAAIRQEVPGVFVAAPLVRGSGQVVFGNLNWFTVVVGATPDYLIAHEWEVVEGRAFTEDEARTGAKQVLIGETVRAIMFPNQDPIGQVLRIERVPFQVVGILARKGQDMGGRDRDDLVIMPLKTAKQRVLGGRQARETLVSAIQVKAEEAGLMADIEQQVRGLLRQRHRLRPGQPDDFYIRDLSQVLESRAESSRIMALLLAAIASISLVVGGIGIMNIMLVSVTERTREIGLRMAVGARGRDILAQFIVEALTLSLIGGLIGIALGVAGALTTARLADWPMLIQPQAALLAFGFAAAVGLFFGLYPARRAARLDPIEALRQG